MDEESDPEAYHNHFFASELGLGISCFSSRTSSGKLSAINITSGRDQPDGNS